MSTWQTTTKTSSEVTWDNILFSWANITSTWGNIAFWATTTKN